MDRKPTNGIIVGLLLIITGLIVIYTTSVGISYFRTSAQKRDCKQAAERVSKSLANKLVGGLWTENIAPSETVVEEVLTTYVDPWGQPYVARIFSLPEMIKVEVFSRGENKVQDEMKMVMDGPNAGKEMQGDDIIACATKIRKGVIVSHLKGALKSGAASVSEGMISGAAEGASKTAKQTGKTIKDIIHGVKDEPKE